MSFASPAELVDAAFVAHHAITQGSSGVTETVLGGAAASWPSIILGEDTTVGYSKFSYYTTLGLYVLSFPGLWSVVKRATKTK